MNKVFKFDSFDSAFPEQKIRVNWRIERREMAEELKVGWTAHPYKILAINVQIRNDLDVLREYDIPCEIFDVCKKIFQDLKEMEYQYLKEQNSVVILKEQNL